MRASDGTNVEVAIQDTIRVAEYSHVSDIFPSINRLSTRQQRIKLTRLTPDWVDESTNVALDAHTSYIVDEIDPNTSATNLEATHIAVGDNSGGTTPSQSDTALNNEIARFAVGSVTNSTEILRLTIVLDETQYNGNELAEVGAVDDANTTFFNRALVGPRDKDSSKIFTIDVEFQYLPQ